MNITDKLATGNGWILPNGKCLATQGGQNDFDILGEYDTTSTSMFSLITPNTTHDIPKILEYVYKSNYVRVGKYRNIMLFEHGGDRAVSADEMYRLASNMRFKGEPVICKSNLYDPSDPLRKQFFSDCHKY